MMKMIYFFGWCFVLFPATKFCLDFFFYLNVGLIQNVEISSSGWFIVCLAGNLYALILYEVHPLLNTCDDNTYVYVSLTCVIAVGCGDSDSL